MTLDTHSDINVPFYWSKQDCRSLELVASITDALWHVLEFSFSALAPREELNLLQTFCMAVQNLIYCGKCVLVKPLPSHARYKEVRTFSKWDGGRCSIQSKRGVPLFQR